MDIFFGILLVAIVMFVFGHYVGFDKGYAEGEEFGRLIQHVKEIKTQKRYGGK